MEDLKFYVCPHCKNVVYKPHDSGVEVVCCGEPMLLLQANTVDAAKEKHVPVIVTEGDVLEVQVGQTLHPMEDVHYIGFIALQQGKEVIIKTLKPGDKPILTTKAYGDQGSIAYAWCNLHGLWKGENN